MSETVVIRQEQDIRVASLSHLKMIWSKFVGMNKLADTCVDQQQLLGRYSIYLLKVLGFWVSLSLIEYVYCSAMAYWPFSLNQSSPKLI